MTVKTEMDFRTVKLPEYDLQRHADEGGEQEFFEFKFGDKKVTLPVKVGEVDIREGLGQVIARSRKDVEAKYAKQFSELKEQLGNKDMTLEEVRQKLQEIEMERMSAQEKADAIAKREKDSVDKMRKEMDQANARASEWESRFKDQIITNSIIGAVGKYEVNNLEQAALIVRQLGKASVTQGEDGEFKPVLKFIENGEEIDVSPSVFAEKFFALPENSHHLKANLRSGGGSLQHRRAPNGSTIVNGQSLANDPKARSVALEKIRGGEIVQMDK